MKKKVRIVALLLALVLLFSLAPATAIATNSNERISILQPKLEICAGSEDDEQLEPSNGDNAKSETSINIEPKESSELTTKTDDSVKRYTVLLLDVESSFSLYQNDVKVYEVLTPISAMKQAASTFIEQVQNANGTNYVAIVAYSDTASIEASFSTDPDTLMQSIDNLVMGNFGANINDAFLKADELLSEVADETAIKNVVLFTQGVNSVGDSSYAGPYNFFDCTWLLRDSEVYLYEYSNATYNTAYALMEKYNIYSIGFFHSFSSVPEGGQSLLDFARRFSEDIQNAGYQEVDDANNLEFAFGEIASSITVQRGNFKYSGIINSETDTVTEYAYTDSYFCGDAKDYNRSLATMSLCLELSSWSSCEQESWTDKSINAEHLLTGCDRDICIDDPGLGFEEFARNDFWNDTPINDSIGVVAANKRIVDKGEEYTLIALAVRGGGYGSEWASNLTIGNEGNHAGFEEARDNVLSFLTSYINTYVDGSTDNKTNLKLWIVGYSRGGAVANMVAGEINNNGLSIDHINPIDPSDLFCYTFEAPQGVHSSENEGDHPNIHNVLSLNDLVPLVAPTAWDFYRYGETRKTPYKQSDSNFQLALAAMKEELREMGFDPEAIYSIVEEVPSVRLKIDWTKILPFGSPFVSWETTTPTPVYDVLYDTVDLLAEEAIGSRSYYYYHMQAGMRDILGILMHYDGIGAGAYDKILEMFEKENLIEILRPMISLNPFYSYLERKADVQENIRVYLVNSLVDFAELYSVIDSLVEILWRCIEIVAYDLFHGDTSSFDLIVQFATYLTTTGFQPHYPEIVLAWVRYMDPNYNPTAPKTDTAPVTRVLRINCPVDVYAYDSEGNIVASIVGNSKGAEDGILAYRNENDEKVLYLPGNEEYMVDVIACDNCSVSISIGELDTVNNSVVRLVNYCDIPVEIDHFLTAVIPAIPEGEFSYGDKDGSSVVYQLLGDGYYEHPADEDICGQEYANVDYDVSVLVEGNSGKVVGGGTFERGSYAKLEALVLSSGKFEGWYVNDQLISTDTTYRFAVTSDIEIIAKFSEIEFYELKNNATVGGEILNVEGFYPAGTEVSLVAKPNPGYVFDHWSAESCSFMDSHSAETTFIMPASDVAITAHWVPSPDNGIPFVDVPEGSFYYEPVRWAVTNNITNGIDATHFGPTVDCNRAQVVTFLWRAAGSPEPTSSNNPFEDVKESEFYHKAVLWAVEHGITNGIDATHFSPLGICNRAQVVTFLYRTMDSPELESMDNPFTDIQAGAFYEKPVLWAVQNGITNGLSATVFGPNTICNRAQIVTFLYRAFI